MTRTLSGDEKQRLDWIISHAEQFLDYTNEIGNVLHICMAGVHRLRAAPQIVDALENLHKTFPGFFRENDQTASLGVRRKVAKREAELAVREVDRGFPLLHAQAVVTMWGALEDFIRTFLAAWLANDPQARKTPRIANLRIRFGEYEALVPEDRSLYLVELLEQELRTPLKQGVSRFEDLLDVIGLSGALDDELRKTLYEMSQVRNVLVHRRGIADKRFIESCPWFGLGVGDVVTVDHKTYSRYHGAVISYVTEILYRVGDCFGVSIRRSGEDEAVPTPQAESE